MIVILLAAAIGGWFLNYTSLFGLIRGHIASGPAAWLRSVAANAFIFSISGATILKLFQSKTEPWVVVACLMPILAVALNVSYRAALLAASATDEIEKRVDQ